MKFTIPKKSVMAVTGTVSIHGVDCDFDLTGTCDNDERGAPIAASFCESPSLKIGQEVVFPDGTRKVITHAMVGGCLQAEMSDPIG